MTDSDAADVIREYQSAGKACLAAYAEDDAAKTRAEQTRAVLDGCKSRLLKARERYLQACPVDVVSQ